MVAEGGVETNFTYDLRPVVDGPRLQSSEFEMLEMTRIKGSYSLILTPMAWPPPPGAEATITWNNKPARGNSLGSVTVNSTGYA